MNDDERRFIEEHCQIKEKLEIVANEILNNNRPVADVGEESKLNTLGIKITILNHKREYNEKKWKYEAAVYHYMSKRMSKRISYWKIQSLYGIQINTLSKEVMLAKENLNLGKKYQYDRKVELVQSSNYQKSFTYQEEQSLLNSLKNWVINEKQSNPLLSVIHIFNQLSILAYNFGKDKGVYPSYWDNNQRADVCWLMRFEMRHTEEIVTLLNF